MNIKVIQKSLIPYHCKKLSFRSRSVFIYKTLDPETHEIGADPKPCAIGYRYLQGVKLFYGMYLYSTHRIFDNICYETNNGSFQFLAFRK